MAVVTVSSYADFASLIAAFVAAPDPIAYWLDGAGNVEGAVAFVPYGGIVLPKVPDAPSAATFQAAFTTEQLLTKPAFVAPR